MSASFKLLNYYPEGTSLRWLTKSDRCDLCDKMREIEYPEQVVRLLEVSPNNILFPSVERRQINSCKALIITAMVRAFCVC
jgi:hypothetical protein